MVFAGRIKTATVEASPGHATVSRVELRNPPARTFGPFTRVALSINSHQRGTRGNLSIAAGKGAIVAYIKDLGMIVPSLVNQNRVAGVIHVQLLGPERAVVRAALKVNGCFAFANSIGGGLLCGVWPGLGSLCLGLNGRSHLDVWHGWRGFWSCLLSNFGLRGLLAGASQQRHSGGECKNRCTTKPNLHFSPLSEGTLLPSNFRKSYTPVPSAKTPISEYPGRKTTAVFPRASSAGTPSQTAAVHESSRGNLHFTDRGHRQNKHACTPGVLLIHLRPLDSCKTAAGASRPQSVPVMLHPTCAEHIAIRPVGLTVVLRCPLRRIQLFVKRAALFRQRAIVRRRTRRDHSVSACERRRSHAPACRDRGLLTAWLCVAGQTNRVLRCVLNR